MIAVVEKCKRSNTWLFFSNCSRNKNIPKNCDDPIDLLGLGTRADRPVVLFHKQKYFRPFHFVSFCLKMFNFILLAASIQQVDSLEEEMVFSSERQKRNRQKGRLKNAHFFERHNETLDWLNERWTPGEKKATLFSQQREK
jgi:hypothetical protein